MGSPKQTDDEVVEIPLASEDGTATVETSAPETLEDVFDRWFLRFNHDDPEAKAKPTPGWISWMHAGQEIADAGAGHDAVAIMQQVDCVTRHMHTPSAPLDPSWLSSGVYALDTDRFRIRPRNAHAAVPQNWLAVEVSAEQLRNVLANYQRDDVAGAPVGGPLSVEQLPPAPPYPEGARGASYVDGTLVGPLGSPPPGPPAHASAQAEALRRYEREGLPAGSTANCPSGYRILVTPEGYVAAWYSPPRGSEAEAVADAWKHHTEGK